MWAKRTEQLQDLSLVVGLDPLRCLDTADFIARHADRYGIKADLEFRRNHSGHAADRHYVLCHQAGALRSVTGSPSHKPLWIMHLLLVPQHDDGTRVVGGLHTYRRRGRGVEAGHAAQQYRALLDHALAQLEADKPLTTRRAGNVIPLRPFARLAPSA